MLEAFSTQTDSNKDVQRMNFEVAVTDKSLELSSGFLLKKDTDLARVIYVISAFEES